MILVGNYFFLFMVDDLSLLWRSIQGKVVVTELKYMRQRDAMTVCRVSLFLCNCVAMCLWLLDILSSSPRKLP